MPAERGKNNPNINNQSQNALDLTNPCTSCQMWWKGAGAGSGEVPWPPSHFPLAPPAGRVVAGPAGSPCPQPSGRRGRPVQGRLCTPARCRAQLGGRPETHTHLRPAAAGSGPGQPRGAASAPLHESFQPLEHGRGWFLAVCASPLCGRMEGQRVRREVRGHQCRGESRTPGTSAVSPSPGWRVRVTARVSLALSHPILIPLLEQGGERGPLSPLSASHLWLG